MWLDSVTHVPGPYTYTPFGAGYTGGLYVAASNDPPSGGSGGSGGSVWVTADQDAAESPSTG